MREREGEREREREIEERGRVFLIGKLQREEGDDKERQEGGWIVRLWRGV